MDRINYWLYRLAPVSLTVLLPGAILLILLVHWAN